MTRMEKLMRKLIEVAVALMAAAVLLAAAADVAAHGARGSGEKAFWLLQGNQLMKERVGKREIMHVSDTITGEDCEQ